MRIQLSFPTQKLGAFIVRVNTRVKDTLYDPKSMAVYGVTNKEGIIITGNKASEDLSNYILLKENQFAYNPYRVNVGSIGLTPKSIFGVVSPAYIVFETTPELDSEFLLFYLKSPLGLNLIKWYGDRGGVRSALRYDDLTEIDIPALTLEQQKTAMKRFFSVKEKLDTFNHELNHQQESLSMLRQSVLQEAIQGKLVEQNPSDEPAGILLEKIQKEKEQLIKEGKIKKGKPLPPITEDEIPFELPKGWEWVRLGSIAYNFGQKKPDGDFSYIDVSSINNSKGIIGENIRVINAKNAPSRARKIVSHGAIIYSTLTPHLLNIAIIDRNFNPEPIVSAVFAVLYPYQQVSNKYLFYYLRSRFFIDYVKTQMVGIVYPAINDNKLYNGLIAIPPLNEQLRIAEKLDQLMLTCDKLEDTINQSKNHSKALMDTVLQEAFSQCQ